VSMDVHLFDSLYLLRYLPVLLCATLAARAKQPLATRCVEAVEMLNHRHTTVHCSWGLNGRDLSWRYTCLRPASPFQAYILCLCTCLVITVSTSTSVESRCHIEHMCITCISPSIYTFIQLANSHS